MKALLATPLHTGSAEREFINGLLEAHGLYAGWTCLEGQANISRARDLLAQIEECLGALEKPNFDASELAEIDRYALDGSLNLWAKSSEERSG